MNTARAAGGFATAAAQTAALAFGGDNRNPPPTNRDAAETESYTGTNWTEVNDLNTARRYLAGAGLISSALVFGGEVSPPTGKTEEWNGASWIEVSDLNTARSALAGDGNTTNALAFGGEDPAGNLTESWNVPSNVVKTLTD